MWPAGLKSQIIPVWIVLLRKGVYVFVCCPLQVKTEISAESKHQTIQGLAFPLKEPAKKALQQLAQKRINYIQLVSFQVTALTNNPNK